MAAVAIGLGISLFLCPVCSLYEHYVARTQLLGAARELVTDLSALQQKALFSGSRERFGLAMTANRDGYDILERSLVVRNVTFSRGGLITVEFSQNSPQMLYFGREGGPVVTGSKHYYYLSHKQYKDLAVRVAVQPVTGRVEILE